MLSAVRALPNWSTTSAVTVIAPWFRPLRLAAPAVQALPDTVPVTLTLWTPSEKVTVTTRPSLTFVVVPPTITLVTSSALTMLSPAILSFSQIWVSVLSTE